MENLNNQNISEEFLGERKKISEISEKKTERAYQKRDIIKILKKLNGLEKDSPKYDDVMKELKAAYINFEQTERSISLLYKDIEKSKERGYFLDDEEMHYEVYKLNTAYFEKYNLGKSENDHSVDIYRFIDAVKDDPAALESYKDAIDHYIEGIDWRKWHKEKENEHLDVEKLKELSPLTLSENMRIRADTAKTTIKHYVETPKKLSEYMKNQPYYKKEYEKLSSELLENMAKLKSADKEEISLVELNKLTSELMDDLDTLECLVLTEDMGGSILKDAKIGRAGFRIITDGINKRLHDVELIQDKLESLVYEKEAEFAARSVETKTTNERENENENELINNDNAIVLSSDDWKQMMQKLDSREDEQSSKEPDRTSQKTAEMAAER